MNNEERMEELRSERLAELGITKEQAQAIKELLEANNYKVDMDYFWSVNPRYERLDDSPLASITFHNGIFVMTNSSSHWTFEAVQQYKAQVDKVLELLTAIHAIAPTVVDPSFRNKKREQEAQAREAAARKQVAEWNALPERTVVAKLPSGAIVEQVRSKTEYNKNRTTEFWVHFELNGQRFDLYPYITKSGSVLRKKFIEENKSMPAADAERLLRILPELRARQVRGRNGSF